MTIDYAQQVIKIMGHSPGQSSNGLHFLDLSQLRPEFFPLRLRLLSRANVFDEALMIERPSVGPANLAAVQRNPEGCSVLAFALAFIPADLAVLFEQCTYFDRSAGVTQTWFAESVMAAAISSCES